MPRDDEDTPRPAKKKPPREDQDDAPRPAKKKPPRDDEDDAPRARKGPPREDDEERRPAKRRPRDEDEADDYDDAPQGRPRKAKKGGGGAMAHMIPTKNKWALAAYYCGVFSWIPILCFVLGPISFLLGVIGFFKALKSDKKYGIGHAITGMALGILAPIAWVVAWYLIFEKMTREGA